MTKDVVSDEECVLEGRLLVDDLEQFIIRNGNDCVDLFFQVVSAFISDFLTAFPFKGERLGNDSHCEGSHFLGTFSNDRSCTRTSTAAHAGRNEDHVSPLQGLDDFFFAFQGSLFTNLGISTGTEAARQFFTDLDLDIGFGYFQYLVFRVDRNELDTLQAAFYHTVDSVITAATDTYYFYVCKLCHIAISSFRLYNAHPVQ